jgi:pyrroloquinoline quinone (PQQ) biosynthesis protein C
MNTATDLLPRSEFERRLIEAAESFPCQDTRFYQAIAGGRCPKPLLLSYARSTARSAAMFCGSIARMIEQAPNAEARLILLENLLEEEGAFIRGGVGMVVRPDQRHPALATRFLRACGGEESESDLLSIGQDALGPGDQMLAEGRWLEGVAFLLVGQEYKFSGGSALLFEALRQYDFTDWDLAFFAMHGKADMEHGLQAIALMLDNAATREQQDAALSAAQAGARHWFALHGGAAQTERRKSAAAA